MVKSILRPLRTTLGRFVIPVEPPTSTIIYKLPHLSFTEFQKEGPWRNSFINVKPTGDAEGPRRIHA